MFDPLLTLIAAKTKAVGLVAGTAMVTTALVGGGAVAMTAVSSDSALEETVVVEEVLDTTASDLEAVEAVVSDTPTVGIDEPKAPRPLPSDFVCDDSKNHGQNVSAYNKTLDKGPGRGEKVSAVAQSDCGKKAGEESESTEAAAQTEETVSGETDEVEEPKPAKAEKAPKAEKPAKASQSTARGGGKK